MSKPRPNAAAASSPAMRQRILSFGRWFVVVSMIAFGVQHVVLERFVTRIVPGLPEWIPAPTALAYIMGGGLIAASCLILFDRKHTRGVAVALGVLIVVAFVVIHAPRIAPEPLNAGLWTFGLKCLSLAACAFALAASSPTSRSVPSSRGFARTVSDRWLLTLAATFLGVFMMFCSVLHFIFAEFVTVLVPSWIPGGAFWTYFSAIALFAGGLGLLIPRTRRLAAAFSGGMILVWVLVLHIPRALTVRDANETTAVFEALAFGGLALIIACMPRQPTSAACQKAWGRVVGRAPGSQA